MNRIGKCCLAAVAAAALFAPAGHAEQFTMHPHWNGSSIALTRLGDDTVGLPDGTLMQLTDGILIGLHGGVAVEDVLPRLAEIGIAGHRELPGPPGVLRLTVAAGVDPLAASEEIRAIAGVRWSHPDFRVTLHPTQYIPDDTFFDAQWHLHNTGLYTGSVEDADVDAPEAWDIVTGAGVIIAVFDTAIDISHEDLDCVAGYDFVDDDDDPSPELDEPDYPHGTAAAGVAAAVGDNALGVAGTAFGAQIMPVRLIGEGIDLSTVFWAFVWAVDNGADVLSNSWSLSANDCPTVPAYGSIWNAVEYAVTEGRGGLGTAVVFGSGNGACDIADDGVAANPDIVVVGASLDDDTLAAYSNFGEYVSVVTPSGPEFGGEHTKVRTTDVMGPDGYPAFRGNDNYTGTYWGTSSATPLAAGVIALMIEANPRMTHDQLKTMLEDTADKIDPGFGAYDSDGVSYYYGHGRVNAHAAVTAAYNRAPLQPTLLEPLGEVDYTGATTFDFTGTDPDGDDLAFNLYLYDTGSTDLLATREGVLPPVEIDVPPGEGYTWQVAGVDLWGEGPYSEVGTFTVLGGEEEEVEEADEAPDEAFPSRTPRQDPRAAAARSSAEGQAHGSATVRATIR
ncbi:MAG: S8 family serine peptidase [Deltaproteobacteria bacterium]|nr:S8 family serine peptidase [Deltaproteobacteria bacterium]